MVNKKIKTKKLPGFTPGTPWYKDGSLTDAGKTGMGYVSGGAGLVGNVAELTRQPDNANWIANIGGNAGKFASMGAPLGLWGAGVGAVVGAGLGIVESIDAQKNIDMAKKQKEIDETALGNMYASDAIRTNYNMSNFKNNSVSGFKKGTPVFKSKFNNPSTPNAMLSPGEGVVDGATGRISVVPGNEGIQTDTIPANLANGSMVGSKMKQQVIPGGKSTPADILKRLEMVQSNNDKLLSNKKIRTKLESDTININKFNIQNQIENLRKYNTLVNPNPVQTAGLPGYHEGAAHTHNDGKIFWTAGQGFGSTASSSTKILNDEIGQNEEIEYSDGVNSIKGTLHDLKLQFGDKFNMNFVKKLTPAASTETATTLNKLDLITNPGTILAGSATTIEDKNIVTVTGADGSVSKTFNPSGSGRQMFGGSSNENQDLSQSILSDKSTDAVRTDPSFGVDPSFSRDLGSVGGYTSPIRTSRININSDGNAIDGKLNLSSLNLTSGRPGQIQQPNPYNNGNNPTMDEYNKIISEVGKTTASIKPAITVNEAIQSSSESLFQGNGTNVSIGAKVSKNASKAPSVTPTISITEVSNNDAENAAKMNAKNAWDGINPDTGLPYGSEDNYLGSGDLKKQNDGSVDSKFDIESLANSLGSLAPIAFNAWNSKPEIIKPVYESYVNPNQRYNISTKLAALQKEKSIARSNFKNTNTGSGSNAAFASSISANGLDKLTGLMSEAENTNNAYRKEYANTANEYSRMNNAEKRRVNDLTMKQEAAGRAIWGKNAEMLSQYSQTQELMRNQRLSDKNNSNIFAIYASASPELKKVLRKDNPGLFGNA